MMPLLDEIAVEYEGGWTIAKINVDEHKVSARGIRAGIPP